LLWNINDAACRSRHQRTDPQGGRLIGRTPSGLHVDQFNLKTALNISFTAFSAFWCASGS
jgi:hypothetical protein